MTDQEAENQVSRSADWRRAQTDPVIVSEQIGPDEVVLQLEIPADLFQLQGHFPGQAIVPGVAQLDWALQFARRYFALDGELNQVTQLKYRRILQPGDDVSLHLNRRGDGSSVSFSFAGPEVHYSSGNLKLRAP